MFRHLKDPVLPLSSTTQCYVIMILLLSTLPLEALLEIFSYLVAEDRKSLRQTSARLRKDLTESYWKGCIVDIRDTEPRRYMNDMDEPEDRVVGDPLRNDQREYAEPNIISRVFFNSLRYDSWFATKHIKKVFIINYQEDWSQGGKRGFSRTHLPSLRRITCLGTVKFFEPSSRQGLFDPKSMKPLSKLVKEENFGGVLDVSAEDSNNVVSFCSILETLRYTAKSITLLDLDSSFNNIQVPENLVLENVEDLRIKLHQESPSLFLPFLRIVSTWPKLKSFSLEITIRTFHPRRPDVRYDLYAAPCCIEVLREIPSNIARCQLAVEILFDGYFHRWYLDSYDIVPAMTLPQVTHLKITNIDHFERGAFFMSLVQCPNAQVEGVYNFSHYRFDSRLQWLNSNWVSRLTTLTIDFCGNPDYDVIPYLRNIGSISRIKIVTWALFNHNFRDDTDAKRLIDYLGQHFVSLVGTEETHLDLESILEKSEFASLSLEPLVIRLFQQAFTNPAENVSVFQNLGRFRSKVRNIMMVLKFITCMELLLLKIREMDSVQYLHIDIQDWFYISPQLHALSFYHTSLSQILITYLGEIPGSAEIDVPMTPSVANNPDTLRSVLFSRDVLLEKVTRYLPTNRHWYLLKMDAQISSESVSYIPQEHNDAHSSPPESDNEWDYHFYSDVSEDISDNNDRGNISEDDGEENRAADDDDGTNYEGYESDVYANAQPVIYESEEESDASRANDANISIEEITGTIQRAARLNMFAVLSLAAIIDFKTKHPFSRKLMDEAFRPQSGVQPFKFETSVDKEAIYRDDFDGWL